MPARVVFDNLGEIPIEAFTVFGMNSKPKTTNPIGYFGTGLKYALAVLCREKIRVQLFIGKVEYEFYPTLTTFRGKEFQQIKMKRRKDLFGRWNYETLPFTTQLGKNWGLWQAFRELYSNMLDEDGTCLWYNSDTPEYHGTAGCTKLIVHGDRFAEEFTKRFETFLPEAATSWEASTPVQILRKPSKFVYWRGLRVFDMPKDMTSRFTYNIMAPLELTEDRTVKYTHEMYRKVAEALSTLQGTQALSDLEQALINNEGTFESGIDWQWLYNAPGEAFKAFAFKYRRKLGGSLGSYVSYHMPVAKPKVPVNWLPELRFAIEADLDITFGKIIRKHREEVLKALKDYEDSGQYAPYEEPKKELPEPVAEPEAGTPEVPIPF